MSRIGKKPIEIAEKVYIEIDAGIIKVKGPKGELNWNYPDTIKVSANGGTISVERTGDSKAERALHGLARSIISNMVIGVSQGYHPGTAVATITVTCSRPWSPAAGFAAGT